MRIALATVTILITTTLTAQAQPPAPRTRTRPRAALNPAHEKMKIQADQAYQKGDFQRSVELTSVVLSQNPTDHVAYYLRASANVELGQTNGNAAVVRRGITDAREALRISDTRDADYYLPYLYGMTILARMENKKEHAKIVVSVATPIIGRPTLTDEEKANLLYQRAMGQVVLEEFEKAATDFQTATKLVPSHLGAFVALADSYVAAGKTELAVNAFANAVKAFPSDPLVHNNQGSHFQQQGKNQEAIAAFTRALELDVNYFVAYTNRGFALMESGQLEAAESDFSASLKVNPQQPQVHSLRGTCYTRMGRLQDSIADYKRVVALDTRNAVARADLGFAQYFAGEHAAAIQTFDAAITLDRNVRFLEPWSYLALLESGQDALAGQRLAAAAKTEPAQRTWYEHLIQFLMGATDAETLLKSVNKQDAATRIAQECEAHFFIARSLERSGKTDSARQHYQQAIDSKQEQLSAFRGATIALKRIGPAEKATKTPTDKPAKTPSDESN